MPILAHSPFLLNLLVVLSRDLNPKKFVAMTGEVEQERVRGTKSVVKGVSPLLYPHLSAHLLSAWHL
jgi:hypothetical protein